MEAAPATPPAPPAALPGDVAACHEMLRRQQALIDEQRQTLAEMGREKQALLHRMAQLLRRLYGRRSERLDAAQLLLFGQAIESIEAAQAAAGEAGAAPAPGSPARRRGRPHGRRPLPDHLPRHRIEHPLDPRDLLCPCGCTRRRIGEEVSEQLEYQPASFFVFRHVRPKYACPDPTCPHSPAVVIADKPPQPIEKGLPGPGLIAHVITSKYADHLPLYRLEGMLARHGVDLDRSTLGGWVEAAADLLLPLVLLIASLVRRSKVIGTDDTTVPVLDERGDKARTGHLWVYRGDASFPYTALDYSPDHGGEWPRKFLSGFEGFLQADAFSGYDALYATGKVIEVGCMAHARRKFYEAKDSDPVAAHEALAFIRRLYEVEEKAKDLDAAGRRAMRQEQSVPVLGDLHVWLLQQQTRCLPKSPPGGAIGYALNQWPALNRYAGDGDLAIDNNAVEREMKAVAVGRKNWLFAGSDEGGKRAAVLYSLIASARRHGVDPQAWLTDVLARIPSTPLSQLAQFLPDRWKADAAAHPPNEKRPPPPPTAPAAEHRRLPHPLNNALIPQAAPRSHHGAATPPCANDVPRPRIMRLPLAGRLWTVVVEGQYRRGRPGDQGLKLIKKAACVVGHLGCSAGVGESNLGGGAPAAVDDLAACRWRAEKF